MQLEGNAERSVYIHFYSSQYYQEGNTTKEIEGQKKMEKYHGEEIKKKLSFQIVFGNFVEFQIKRLGRSEYW